MGEVDNSILYKNHRLYGKSGRMCGRCLTNLVYRLDQVGHWFRSNPQGDLERTEYMKRISRAEVVKKGPPGQAAARDEDLRENNPLLHDHLVVAAFDDGKPRATSTFLVFCQDGQWKACLSERNEDLVAFVSADGFFELLDAVERLLREERLEWRAARQGRKK